MKTKTLVAALLLVGLIAGCRSIAEPGSTPAMIARITTTLPAGPAATQTVTETFVRTATPTLTATSIPPTATKTPTLQPTPTALPGISTENAREVLTRLVQENGGCQLPCIMGLAPGLSDQAAVDAFIHYFQENARESQDIVENVNVWGHVNKDQGGMRLMFWKNQVSVQVGLGYRLNEDRVGYLDFFGEAYQHLDDGGMKMLYGSPYYFDLLGQFNIAQVLLTYGEPNQIFIRVHPDDLWHPSPPAQYQFDIVLFYAQPGFSIVYTVLRAEEDGYYVGCPTQPHSLNITSWFPSSLATLADAIQEFERVNSISQQKVDGYKLIEDATALTDIDFYEAFQNPNTDVCIQTLKELWPTPQ